MFALILLGIDLFLAYHPVQCTLVLHERFVMVRSLGMVVKSALQPEFLFLIPVCCSVSELPQS
jgi:hypothetical protein